MAATDSPVSRPPTSSAPPARTPSRWRSPPSSPCLGGGGDADRPVVARDRGVAPGGRRAQRRHPARGRDQPFPRPSEPWPWRSPPGRRARQPSSARRPSSGASGPATAVGRPGGHDRPASSSTHRYVGRARSRPPTPNRSAEPASGPRRRRWALSAPPAPNRKVAFVAGHDAVAGARRRQGHGRRGRGPRCPYDAPSRSASGPAVGRRHLAGAGGRWRSSARPTAPRRPGSRASPRPGRAVRRHDAAGVQARSPARPLVLQVGGPDRVAVRALVRPLGDGVDQVDLGAVDGQPPVELGDLRPATSANASDPRSIGVQGGRPGRRRGVGRPVVVVERDGHDVGLELGDRLVGGGHDRPRRRRRVGVAHVVCSRVNRPWPHRPMTFTSTPARSRARLAWPPASAAIESPKMRPAWARGGRPPRAGSPVLRPPTGSDHRAT